MAAAAAATAAAAFDVLVAGFALCRINDAFDEDGGTGVGTGGTHGTQVFIVVVFADEGK